ncbi:hypothetical protein EVAR_43457_1 [Eumeta japonica]|uniref:Uncharacterized protein n=1 Tax=Eumeta variegata TaxID=151549 RepID=A0A4C1Y8X5_EUMVA|nr:hypothetical protein EVAR_43457_1 [Eumeta japonica]
MRAAKFEAINNITIPPKARRADLRLRCAGGGSGEHVLRIVNTLYFSLKFRVTGQRRETLPLKLARRALHDQLSKLLLLSKNSVSMLFLSVSINRSLKNSLIEKLWLIKPSSHGYLSYLNGLNSIEDSVQQFAHNDVVYPRNMIAEPMYLPERSDGTPDILDGIG